MLYNWKDERNYRKFQMPDGSIRCFVFVDGQSVEVDIELYTMYSRMDRRERYQQERDAGRLLPLGCVTAEDLTPEKCFLPPENVEDIVIDAADRLEWRALLKKLPQALSRLNEREQRLILALYIDGRSERAVASELGVSQPAVHKRQVRVLKKLKKFFEKP